jgi:GTPase SAR1 family protein
MSRVSPFFFLALLVLTKPHFPFFMSLFRYFQIFYKDAVAAVIVFDIARPITLDSVRKWKSEIDEKVRLSDPGESHIPVVLLANKVCIDSLFQAFI